MLRRFFNRLTDKDYKDASFQELRTGCVEGSESAKREFIARFQGVVWRATRSRLPNAPPQDQEEVVADTFIALLTNNAEILMRFDPLKGLSPSSYVRRQALMQSSNKSRHLHSQKRSRETLSSTEEGARLIEQKADNTPSPETLLEQNEQLVKLKSQLQQRLSPALLLTFDALYVRQLSVEAAAKKLGCSQASIYTRKRRITLALQELLAENSRCA